MNDIDRVVAMFRTHSGHLDRLALPAPQPVSLSEQVEGARLAVTLSQMCTKIKARGSI